MARFDGSWFRAYKMTDVFKKHLLYELELREGILAGDGDSSRAEEIRDCMGATYAELNQNERSELIEFQNEWSAAQQNVCTEMSRHNWDAAKIAQIAFDRIRDFRMGVDS